MARVGEPGLISSSSIPAGLAAIGQPVSVCHQWSMTGMPSRSEAQRCVSGSRRSPARKRYVSDETSYCARNSPFGSSFLIARNAVGAVKTDFTPFSWTTRQNWPASGVPTGLPS